MEPRAELNEIGYGKWEGLSKETVATRLSRRLHQLAGRSGLACTSGGELAVTVAASGFGQVIQENRAAIYKRKRAGSVSQGENQNYSLRHAGN